MYQTNLTETEWQYITKVLNLQARKRKYYLRMIWNTIRLPEALFRSIGLFISLDSVRYCLVNDVYIEYKVPVFDIPDISLYTAFHLP